nr:glycosyltransferase family 39 protein [Dyella soli]
MLAAVVLLAAGIGMRTPTPSDEPRFALVAHQMVASGNWLIPHRGTDWYSDKPPLFMALQAASFKVTGDWEIAFLLPSLLASLGTLWLVYDLGRRWWGHRAGLMAALALLCTVQFVFQAKRGQIDPTVTFLITAANAGLLRHLVLGPSRLALWAGCFAAGLAVITKGVGFLPFLILVPWWFARRLRWNGLAPTGDGAKAWAGGIVAFFAAMALWLVPLALYLNTHRSPAAQAYLDDILFNQTFHRYVHPWNSFQPPWFYLEVIATSWLPPALALPWLVPAWRTALKGKDARLLLPLAWVVIVILFFSLTRAKRDVYIMPALPMFALCSGPWLAGILERKGAQWVAIGFLLALASVTLTIGTQGLIHPSAWINRFVTARQLEPSQARVIWWSLTVVGAWLAGCAAILRLRNAGLAVLVGLGGMWIAWGVVMAPVLARASSPARLVDRVEQVVGPDSLALVAWKEEIPLGFDRQLTDFGFVTPWHEQLADAIRWLEQAPQDRWVLVQAAVMSPCVREDMTTDVGVTSGRHWRLFRLDAVRPECHGGEVPTGRAESWGDIDRLP